MHLWLALQNQHGLWLGALMVVLAGACVPCAVHIWQRSHPGVLHRVMCCALVMVALHGSLLLGGPAEGHKHLAGQGAGSVASQAGHLLAVIGLELVTALLAATLVARLRGTQHAAGPVQWPGEMTRTGVRASSCCAPAPATSRRTASIVKGHAQIDNPRAGTCVYRESIN